MQRNKHVHVQALIAQSSVEGLDHAAHGGLAGQDEAELHAAQVTPLVARFGRVFRSVVDSCREGRRPLERDLGQ